MQIHMLLSYASQFCIVSLHKQSNKSINHMIDFQDGVIL